MDGLLIALLDRVRTYKVGLWTYHPNLCPYQLASVGYVMYTNNILQCQVCNHTVHIQYAGDQFSYNQLSDGLKEHHCNCIYYNQPMTKPTQQTLYLSMDELMDHIQKDNNTKTILPLLNSKAITQQIAPYQATMNTIMKRYGIDQTNFKITFYLAFFGWVYKSQQQTLECMFCGRLITLPGKFITTDKDQQQLSMYTITQQQLFNPIDQHRYFCLWMNVLDEFKGWQIYLQHLWDKLDEIDSLFNKQKPETTKKIRVQLDRYLETFHSKTQQTFNQIRNVMQSCRKLKSGLMEPLQDQNQGKRSRQIQHFVDDIEQQCRQSIKQIKVNQNQI